MFAQAGTELKLDNVKVVALYDPESGRILHSHTVAVFEGGRSLTDEEATEAAREYAKRLGHPAERLQVKVSNDPEHAARPHRIDPESGDFQALEVPNLGRRHPPDGDSAY